MSPFRKALVAAFISMTVASFSLASYIMYLYFGAYDVGLSLRVSINNVIVNYTKYSNPTLVSVLTNLTVVNDTPLLLKLVYLQEKLYLNGNPVEEGAFSYYFNPVELHSQKNTTIIFEIPYVLANKVTTSSPKVWQARIYVIVEGVPLFPRGARYTRFVSYSG